MLNKLRCYKDFIANNPEQKIHSFYIQHIFSTFKYFGRELLIIDVSRQNFTCIKWHGDISNVPGPKDVDINCFVIW